jgi:hypothetical protein
MLRLANPSAASKNRSERLHGTIELERAVFLIAGEALANRFVSTNGLDIETLARL